MSLQILSVEDRSSFGSLVYFEAPMLKFQKENHLTSLSRVRAVLAGKQHFVAVAPTLFVELENVLGS